MHPMFTQTPPSLSFSTTAVDRPSWAARMAQTYPAGPPPTPITSNEATMLLQGSVISGQWSVIIGQRSVPVSIPHYPLITDHRPLPDECQRILEQQLQRLQKLGPGRAV